MSGADQIVAHLLETDDDDLKDLYDVPPGEAGPTTVKGFKIGRMKVVDMPRYTFLISFLTPVAYYDKIMGIFYRTSKQWSPTTNGHIREWQSMIANSPEWKDNPANQEWEGPQWRAEYWHVKYPRFQRRRQALISQLFRSLMPTMKMKARTKVTMYRVDPRMRIGSRPKRWVTGHLKHHDTGDEGLPRPGDEGFEEFFKDFDPDDPETWGWDSGYGSRSREPHEPGE